MRDLPYPGDRPHPSDIPRYLPPRSWHDAIRANIPGEYLEGTDVYSTTPLLHSELQVRICFLSITNPRGAKNLPPGLYVLTQFDNDPDDDELMERMHHISDFFSEFLATYVPEKPATTTAPVPEEVRERVELPDELEDLSLDLNQAFELRPTGKSIDDYVVLEISPTTPTGFGDALQRNLGTPGAVSFSPLGE